MASLSYILLAAVIWQSKALEYFAYFIGENLPVTRNISYFDDLFSAGVTEIIFVGFTVAANGTITRTFSNENELLLARQAANAHGARLSFMTGAIPFINDGPAAFSKFYASVNNMFEKYKFDGINFDWEFSATTDDWKKYRDLMKGTKENVKKNGRNANVSVAIGTSFDLYKSIDLCGAADKCLWMGYVYEIGVAVRAIHDWKNAQGLPPDKFALGVPLYGTNAAGVQITYFKLIDMGADPKGNGSFAGYSYASQPMLQEQVNLAINQSLGGLMCWHLGSDLPPEDTRSLTYAIKQKLKPGT